MPPQQDNQAPQFTPPHPPTNQGNNMQQEAGNAIAVVGFVLAFLFPLAGLICSIIGLSKSKKLGGKNRGLAIAGVIISTLIMVIEFIAILIFIVGGVIFIGAPALQKNVRDTERRNDTSAIRSGIETYAANNNGQIPSNATELESALDGQLAFFERPIENGLGNGFYTVYITERTDAVPSSTDGIAGLDTVHVFTGAKCVASSFLDSPGFFYADGGGDFIYAASEGDYAIITTLEVDDKVVCEDNTPGL